MCGLLIGADCVNLFRYLVIYIVFYVTPSTLL